ncbi:MAG: glycosyltransferase family 2 protein [bacterium]
MTVDGIGIVLFLVTVVLCAATYFLYPLAIRLGGRIAPYRTLKREIFPSISVLIAAYNEEKSIERKIRNTLALDYPKERLEILVGSDGSTDGTASIARSFAGQGVRLLDFESNRGKTSVQNDLVRASRGEILVFTDAASFLSRDALRKIVRNFADGRVGGVAGRMRYVDTERNLTTRSQGLYWRYEAKIREMESALGRVIGVDGPLYAVRRDAYVPLENNAISDLLMPLLLLEQGRRVVLEPEALVDEDPNTRSREEFRTRKRIALRGLVGLASHSHLLNPMKHPVLALQIFFHKVLRWFVGPLVLLNAAAAATLSGHALFRVMLAGYIVFFLLAAWGWLRQYQGGKAILLLSVPYYFCLVNLAASAAIVDFFRRKEAVSWVPIRET